jgi:hypothetical protein
MKKINILFLFSAITFSILSLVSCGGDDETSGGGGENVISNAIGTWMCTQSTDTQQGHSAQGLMVGKEITINYDGTCSIRILGSSEEIWYSTKRYWVL